MTVLVQSKCSESSRECGIRVKGPLPKNIPLNSSKVKNVLKLMEIKTNAYISFLRTSCTLNLILSAWQGWKI